MRFLHAIYLTLFVTILIACEQPKEAILQTEPIATLEQPIQHWINTHTTVRFAPSHAERVSDPQGTQDMSNWTGSVYRGIPVTVVATQGEWKKVVYNTDARGWMLTSELLQQTQLGKATTLKELKTYRGADFSLANDSLTIPAGTLLFVLEQVNQLSLVNYDGEKTAWVETSNLTQEKQEVHVSESIEKAQWLRSDNAPNGRVLDKARIKYPNAKLLDTLADHIRFRDFNPTPTLPTADLADPKP